MKIFINYRRDDARAEAARLRDRLVAHFGERAVFMDVETLSPGQRFDQELLRELAQCDVLLSVIGRHWLTMVRDRIERGERDYVREEIATALARGIPVIPVLVDRTPLPRADDLPSDMRDLVLHHKQEVSHDTFKRDVEALIGALEKLRPAQKRGTGAAVIMAAATAATVVIAGLLAAFSFGVLDPSSRNAAKSEDQARSGGDAKRVAMLDGSPDSPVEKLATPKAPYAAQDCLDICPALMVLPSGEFAMGAADGEPDERPPHKVTIGKSFALGVREVTFAEWDACVADGGCRHKPTADWGRGRQPVMRVSWHDATTQYLPWLSRRTSQAYRLPTEAEWEYAARAGSSAAYATGATITPKQAQFFDRRAVEAGSFAANAWGLFDMHGNVREWVADCHSDTYGLAPKDGIPLETAKDCVRVARGGSWEDGSDSDRPADRDRPNALRSANRDWESADSRLTTIGFRVARDL